MKTLTTHTARARRATIGPALFALLLVAGFACDSGDTNRASTTTGNGNAITGNATNTATNSDGNHSSGDGDGASGDGDNGAGGNGGPRVDLTDHAVALVAAWAELPGEDRATVTAYSWSGQWFETATEELDLGAEYRMVRSEHRDALADVAGLLDAVPAEAIETPASWLARASLHGLLARLANEELLAGRTPDAVAERVASALPVLFAVARDRLPPLADPAETGPDANELTSRPRLDDLTAMCQGLLAAAALSAGVGRESTGGLATAASEIDDAADRVRRLAHLYPLVPAARVAVDRVLAAIAEAWPAVVLDAVAAQAALDAAVFDAGDSARGPEYQWMQVTRELGVDDVWPADDTPIDMQLTVERDLIEERLTELVAACRGVDEPAAQIRELATRAQLLFDELAASESTGRILARLAQRTRDHAQQALRTLARLSVARLAVAIETYGSELGYYPSRLSALEDDYFPRDLPPDPIGGAGAAWQYGRQGSRYELASRNDGAVGWSPE